MKSIVALTLLSVLFVACNTQKHAYEDIFPSDTPDGIEFDLSIGDFNAIIGDSAIMVDANGNATVFYQELEGEKLEAAMYYFGTKGKQPLYEIIFMYKSEAERDADALRMLGEKTNEEGWQLQREPYDVKAWTYESKLIIAARIPTTEWFEEE